jgi:WD40 repeat protein
LRGHANFVRSLVFSPDGKQLASGSYDNTVRLWDAQTGDELITFRGHTQGVYTVAFSPDGQRLASASQDGTIRLWDATRDPRGLSLRPPAAEVRSFAVSSDSRELTALCYDGTVVVWNLEDGKRRQLRTLSGRPDKRSRTDISAAARWCAWTKGQRSVQIWDLMNDKEACPLLDHPDEVMCVSFSPDGTSLATGSIDRTVRIWEVASGRMLQSFGEHPKAIRQVHYLPGGSGLAVVSWEGTVAVWDLHGGRQTNSYPAGRRAIFTVASLHRGRVLALSGKDGQVVAWYLDDDSETPLFRRPGVNLWSLNSAPDDTRFAAPSDLTTVKLWDPKTGHECLTLRLDKQRVLRAAFTPDGQKLIILDNGGGLRVCDGSPQTGSDSAAP